MPDLHCPDHDEQALTAFLSVASQVQPDELVIIGDFIDCKAPARWSKDTAAEYAETLPGEIDAGRAVLGRIRGAVGDAARISFLVGNHEDRIGSYLRRYAPAVMGIVPSLPELLDFAGLGVGLQAQPYRLAPGVCAIHGKLLSSVLGSAGQSAFKERVRHGTSIVQGHSHRLGLGWDRQDRARFWMECGHLADPAQAGYLDFGHANWQQGYGLLEMRGDLVFPSVHAIHDGISEGVR